MSTLGDAAGVIRTISSGRRVMRKRAHYKPTAASVNVPQPSSVALRSQVPSYFAVALRRLR